MKAAIVNLESALSVLATNEPINRADGNIVQADRELECAREIREALALLREAVRPDYQKRVIIEKENLDARLERLDGFIGKSLYAAASRVEQERLCRQANLMRDYSAVLGERIGEFDVVPVDKSAGV